MCIIMKQREFPFGQIYVDAAAEKHAKYREWMNNLWKNAAPIGDIFSNASAMDFTGGPSIPLSILIGSEGQPEFGFVKGIDAKYWGPQFPIEYAYETHR